MKKIFIFTLVISTLLVGCSAPTPEVTEDREEIYTIPEKETYTEFEVSEDNSPMNEDIVVAVLDIPSNIAIDIETPYNPMSFNLDTWTYETINPYESEGMITINASCDMVTDEGIAELYVSEGMNNSEAVDFYNREDWMTYTDYNDADVLYYDTLYGSHVEDKYKVARYSEEWSACEEEDAKAFIQTLTTNLAVGITPTVEMETDDVVYYVGEFNPDYVHGFTFDEDKLPCLVSFYKNTKMLRGIHIDLDTAYYRDNVVTNFKWDYMLDSKDCASASPVGFEEVFGIRE